MQQVSRTVYTKGLREAYVLMDGAGHYSVICTGCGLNQYKAGLAPALALLSSHANTCNR
ncbi:hypothetical protein [Polymorphospora rubra]|uniref:Uncharacterized protein n=1 Tax=Polymorphospora rubra TaxID=338584 RepID=A0A810N2F2_9ACTN|nr:hypothetical protein [Polymorphospora rubra]BCJ65878.1 hypothetical protein Prubr_28990 [Polymorphospora rubra]